MGHEKLHKRETGKVNLVACNNSKPGPQSTPVGGLRKGAMPKGSPKSSLSNDDLLDYYLGFQ